MQSGRWNGKCGRNYKWWSGVYIPVACPVVRAMTHGGSDKVVTSFLWSELQTWQSWVLDSEALSPDGLHLWFYTRTHTGTLRKTPMGGRFFSSTSATLLPSFLPVTTSSFFVAYSFFCFNKRNTLNAKCSSEAWSVWREISDKSVFHHP